MFEGRTEAGRRLAARLRVLRAVPDLLVLALQHSLPVAKPIAETLGAELDVLMLSTLGAPTAPELTIGAVALGGTRVLDQEMIERLGVADEVVDTVALDAECELSDRALRCRSSTTPPHTRGRHVILADDGIAAGAILRFAVLTLRKQGVARTTLAAAKEPQSVARHLASIVDSIVCDATMVRSAADWSFHAQPVGDRQAKFILDSMPPQPQAPSGEALGL